MAGWSDGPAPRSSPAGGCCACRSPAAPYRPAPRAEPRRAWHRGGPNDDFYRIDTALVVPAVDPQTGGCRIHGMVDREITIGYRELLDRRIIEKW